MQVNDREQKLSLRTLQLVPLLQGPKPIAKMWYASRLNSAEHQVSGRGRTARQKGMTSGEQPDVSMQASTLPECARRMHLGVQSVAAPHLVVALAHGKVEVRMQVFTPYAWSRAGQITKIGESYIYTYASDYTDTLSYKTCFT